MDKSKKENDQYFYQNNLIKNIEKPRDIVTKEVLCFWSDLLGIGNVFFEKNWELNDKDKLDIFNRLRNAHSEFLRQTSAHGEKSIILNDGLVKVGLIDELIHPDLIGYYLRGCILTHLSVNKVEAENKYPGCRSILSYGESIDYLESEIKYDDYVLNYTKPNPEDLSTIAQKNGNPTIVYNPSPFQMNTAFSKSYILDSLGSRYGIEGNKIFAEHSILEFSRKIAQRNSLIYREFYNEGMLTVLVLKEENRPSFGFEFDKTIELTYKNWNTKVYRLKSFFPPDEDMREFKFDL